MRHPFTIKTRPDSGKWCADGYIDGRRWRFTTSYESEKQHEAAAHREAAAEYLSECTLRRAVADPKIVAELDTVTLLAKYLDGPVAARARKRHGRYAAQLEATLVDYLTDRFTLLSQFTSLAWGQWMDECHGRKDSPIKLRSVQRITSAVNGFLDYCVAVGALQTRPTLPYPAADEVATEASERRPFTVEERDAFLAAVAKLDQRAWRIYTVLLYTGLRKSGLEKMQRRWIDFNSGFVKFPAAALKDKKGRTFWLRKEALAAVEAELATHKHDDAVPMDEVVFGHFDFDGHNGKKRSGLFWTACREAGIEDWTGLTAHHVTRHTACTIAGLQGATLAELMALGGWRTPLMAMRYLHIDANAAKRAAERL